VAGGRGAPGGRPRLLGAAAADGLPAARDQGLPQLALQVRMDSRNAVRSSHAQRKGTRLQAESCILGMCSTAPACMTAFACRTCCGCVDAASRIALIHNPKGAADGPSRVAQPAGQMANTDSSSA